MALPITITMPLNMTMSAARPALRLAAEAIGRVNMNPCRSVHLCHPATAGTDGLETTMPETPVVYLLESMLDASA